MAAASPTAATPHPPALAASYAACAHLARTHYENFPVASRFLPARLRPHVAAIYAFARTADDLADEPGRDPSERLALLAHYRATLRTLAGGPRLPALPGPPPVVSETGATPAAPDFFWPALADTVTRFDLPLSLFDDLLTAFTQDVTTTRYATWDAVLDYCRRSANPVGRLVLRLHGYHDATLEAASDAVCTALQLTNFWQDLAVDWPRGRLYVPEETWRAHGADPADLDRRTWTGPWQRALADCGVRTRACFTAGRPVADGVHGRLRHELRATWLGGSRILDQLEARRFDVFAARPSLGVTDAMVIACRVLAWRRASRTA